MLVSRGNIRIKEYLKVTFMDKENCCVFREEGDGDIFTWKNYDINSIILLSNSYQGRFTFALVTFGYLLCFDLVFN